MPLFMRDFRLQAIRESNYLTPNSHMNFQSVVATLNQFWSDRGCAIVQSYDTEKGAATKSHHTFLRSIGPEPWSVAYIEPCRRPGDGRYGQNPNRYQHYYQYQVLIKPSPDNIQDIYLDSLRAVGIEPADHDIRFVEDNWEDAAMGAWGVGWEVWLDGMEVTQFTYFQQCGGIDCRPVSIEITYGLERLCMYLQDVDSICQNPMERYSHLWLISISNRKSSSLPTILKRPILNYYLPYSTSTSKKPNN